MISIALFLSLAVAGNLYSQTIPADVPIVCTVEGNSASLTNYKVIYNDIYIMDIRWKYIGTIPENKKMSIPNHDWRNEYIQFYYVEKENRTEYKLETHRIVSEYLGWYQDEQGKWHQTPPQVYNRDELLGMKPATEWDYGSYEKKVNADWWYKPSTKITQSGMTYYMRIAETGEWFAYRLVFGTRK